MSGDRPRLKKAVAAGELISLLLRQKGLERRIEECRAWLAWDEVVGPQIAAHARPLRVREGVLEVRVDQPVWMQQLQLLKPQILAKLNRRHGQQVFRDIFWRQGRLEKGFTRTAAEEIPWRSVQLSPEEERAVGELLAGLEDSELRQILRKIVEKQFRLEKTRRQQDQGRTLPS